MLKKEYLKRKARKVTASVLALLMCVSVFAQVLPDMTAGKALSGVSVGMTAAVGLPTAASAPAEVVTDEIPAEATEGEEQINETVSLVKAVSPSDATLSDIDVLFPFEAVSAADIASTDVSASDVLSPEFSAERKINGWTISVYAPEGVIPENAELRITNVNGALRDKAEAVADVEFDILVDVTFFADGEEIQPDTENGLVQVSLTKDGAVSDAFQLYHFNEAVTDVEILDTEIDGDTATAEVEHFSLIGGNDTIKTWTAFADAVANAKSGDEIKLDGDIVRDADATAITISKNLTIDLNGHKISSTSASKDNGNLFTMSGSGELRVTVKNGTIDGFKTSGDGGAFNLSGGSVYLTLGYVTVKNCAARYGGAINMENANLTLYDTTITGCSAVDGGGISATSAVVVSDGGVNIYGNSAESGGGVSLYNSQLVLTYGDTNIHGNNGNNGYTDLYIGEVNNKNASVFVGNEQVSPIYISQSSGFNRPFCTQPYEDCHGFFVSTRPNYIIGEKSSAYGNGVGFVSGRIAVVDPAMKNGTVALNGANGKSVMEFGGGGSGETVSLTVTPAAGYELDKLYYVKYDTTDQVAITTYDETNKKYSFAMPDTDVTIYATFNAKLLKVGDFFYTAQDGSKLSPYEGTLMFTVTDATKKTVSVEMGTSFPTGKLSVPEKVTGPDGIEYSVTSFGEAAFAGSYITSVTIPSSITSIGKSVFDSCEQLTSVTIPNSVESIGNNAFHGCSSLASVTIPNSVESIGNNAFNGCSSLASVTIPSSIKSIGMSAFNFCSSLTSVIMQSICPEGATFNTACFRGVGKSDAPAKLVLPSGWNGTAWVSSTKSWYAGYFALAKSVTVAECENGKAEVDMLAALKDETVTVTVTPATGYVLDKLTYKAGTADPVDIKLNEGKYTFAMPENDVTVTATFKAKPDGSKENPWLIGKNKPSDVTAYFDKDTKTLTIEGTGATMDWTGNLRPEWSSSGVQNLVVKSGVTALGKMIFWNSNSILTADLGGVTEIGDMAFYCARKLESVTANSLVTAKINAFSSCGLKSIDFPNLTTAGNSAFNNNINLKSASLPKLAVISDHCFDGCSALEAYDFSNVTSIEASGFGNCSNLAKIDIPGNTVLGDSAFTFCSRVKSVSIPNVTSLGGQAFFGVGAMSTAGKFSVTLSPDLTEIPSMCFCGMTNMNKMIFTSESMPTIGNAAFNNVTADIYFPATWLSDALKLEDLNKTSAASGLYQYGGKLTYHACFAVETAEAVNGSVESDKDLAESGETVTVTVTPDADYKLDKLTVKKTGTSDTVDCTKVDDTTYTFEMPDSDVTVSATFKAAVNTFYSDASGKNTSVDGTAAGMVLRYDVKDDDTVYIKKKDTFTNISGDLTIPESVTYDGTAYKVTKINSLAFKDCTGLTSVTIPAGVTEILTGAFDSCTGLTSVTMLGASMTFNGKPPFNKVGTPEAPVTLYITSAWSGDKPTDSATQWHGGYFKVDTLRKVNILNTQNGTVTSVSPEYVPDSAEGEDRVVTLKCAPNDGYVLSPMFAYRNGTPNPGPLTVVDPCTITFIMPNKNQDVYIQPMFRNHPTHTWVYENGTTDNIIVARCNKAGCEGCKYHFDADAPTLTLTAEDAGFTGSPYTGASIEDNITAVVEGAAPTIMYRGVAPTVYDDSSTAPTAEGKYEAYVTLGTAPDEVTAVKQFNIGTPKADTTALEAAVDAAKAADQADYTADVWTQILGYVEDSGDYIGKDLPTSAQDEIDALTADLTDALDAKADFSALDDALTNAADYLGSESDYTAASWKDFTDALAEAQSVRSNPATQTAIDSAAKALTDATDALQLAADTTELEKAVADAKAAKQSDYPSTVWDDIADYVKEAEDSYIGKDLSAADYQDAIDDLTTALNEALADKLADYSAVNAALDKIPENLSDYDPDSTTELLKAQDAVVTGLHVDKQSDVDKFAEDLEKALALLRLKGDKNLISATAPAVLYMGDSAQKVTTETAADGGDVTYSVDGTAVSVGTDGSITVSEPGEATITVKAAANDKYAEGTKTIDVTVKKRTQEVKADALTLNPTDVAPTAGAVVSEKKIDGVDPLPASVGKPGAPVYSSSDENVIKVDPATGAVTIVGPGEANILVTVPGNDYFDEITDAAPAVIKVTVEELKILDGQDGKYIIGSKEGLAFHCNGSYESFTTEDGYVEVDGEKVDAANYDVSKGSTIVKFKPAYLDKLKVGKHKLTFVYKNGSVSCNFTVEQKSGGTPGNDPKTGDTTNIILLVNLLLLSAVVVVYFLRRYDLAALIGRKADSTEE